MTLSRFLKYAASAWLAFGTAASAAAANAVDSLAEQVRVAAIRQLERQAAQAGMREPQIAAAVVDGSGSTGRPAACAQPVTIETIDARQARRMRLAAICPGIDGWRRNFVVRASLSARVLVAAVNIAPGQPLGAADVELQRREVADVPDPLSDPAALAGMSGRRAIRAGEVLRASRLVAPLLVRRDDPVGIVARSGPVEVTAAGVALDAGVLGSVIRVRNLKSGTMLRARIVAEATVEPVEMTLSMPPHSAD